MFGVRSLLMVEKLFMRNDLADLLFRRWNDRSSPFSRTVLKEFRRYFRKWNINVW